MVCPRRLSFSQFVVLMCTTNCEKDILLGQTIPTPEPFLFFENPFFLAPFIIESCNAMSLSLLQASRLSKFQMQFVWLQQFVMSVVITR